MPIGPRPKIRPWMPKRGSASVSDLAVMLASKCVTCEAERGCWCLVTYGGTKGRFTDELHIRRVRELWRVKNSAPKTVRRVYRVAPDPSVPEAAPMPG